MPIIVAITVVIVGLLFWGIGIYNTLVFTRERIEDAKLQMLIQIKSRWDIVRVLTNLTEEFSKDDARSLEDTIDKMISVDENSSIKEIETLERELDDILRTLSKVVKNHVKLEESKTYIDTLESVDKSSVRLKEAKSKYNNKVARMNRKVDMFPANIVSSMFGFKKREYLENTNI